MRYSVEQGIESALHDKLSISAGAFHYETDGWRPNNNDNQPRHLQCLCSGRDHAGAQLAGRASTPPMRQWRSLRSSLTPVLSTPFPLIAGSIKISGGWGGVIRRRRTPTCCFPSFTATAMRIRGMFSRGFRQFGGRPGLPDRSPIPLQERVVNLTAGFGNTGNPIQKSILPGFPPTNSVYSAGAWIRLRQHQPPGRR